MKDQNRKVLAQKEYKQGEVLTFNGDEYALIIGAPGNVRITYKGEGIRLPLMAVWLNLNYQNLNE